MASILTAVSRIALAWLLMTVLAASAGSARGPMGVDPPARPQASWWDRTAVRPGARHPQSRYYTIRSDLAPEDTKRWADLLDVMYDEFSSRLVRGVGVRQRSPGHPNVYMFARQRDYLDTLRTQFGINGMGSGGMFFVSPRGAGLAFWTEGLPRQRVAHVVQHEGFHQFAYAFFGNELPPWLNEGLAEFFGESVAEGRTVVVGQASPTAVEQVRASVEKGTTIPFLQILQMDSDRWNAAVRDGSARQQYVQAWSMVHYLVYGEGGRHEPGFTALLRHLNDGSRPLDALRKAYGLDTEPEVRQFEDAWKAYARTLRPGAYVAARGRMEFLAEGLRDRWMRGERPADFAALRESLRAGDFRWKAAAHGYVLELSAADDANFEVPTDAANPKPVAFELVPQPKPRGSKERALAEKHPMPPMIRTRGLRPNDVGISWRRDPTDPALFLYDVVVSP